MADLDAKVWSGVLAHLRTNHPGVCRQWFEELEPLALGGGRLTVRAQSNLHRDYLRRDCTAPFNDALRTVTGHLVSIRFVGPEEEAEAPPTPTTTAVRETTPRMAGMIEAKGPARRDDGLVINPDYTFDNFISGPNNRLAHAAAVAVADKPGRSYNPLFIHGGVGLGKTHLLQAVCLRVMERNPGAVLYYISCDGFVNQFMDAVQAGLMNDFRHKFRDVDLLVIDDIHFLAKRDRTQEEFFHTFNSLHQASRQIILSSDAPPEEIPHLEERLVSRFKWGLVAEIQPPGYETRVAILKAKALLRGMDLPEDVAAYLASRIDTNIRELEGAITKIQMQASVEQRKIDLGLAQAALGESTGRVGAAPTIHTIITAVTDFYSLRPADLQSKRRHRSVALPRQVCMYLVRALTRHSLEEIGGYFGGRDHTTVLHALRTVDERRRKSVEFDAVVQTLTERVRGGAQGGEAPVARPA